MSMPLSWQWQLLTDMTAPQIFHILRLRAKIFVAEQQDAYCDPDKHDLHAWHVQAYQTDQLVSYGRVYFDTPTRLKIGRIVVAKEYRGQGIASQLMREILRWVAEHPTYQTLEVVLSAQHHLESFYQSFGFERCGEVYALGPILHIDMQRPALSVKPLS